MNDLEKMFFAQPLQTLVALCLGLASNRRARRETVRAFAALAGELAMRRISSAGAPRAEQPAAAPKIIVVDAQQLRCNARPSQTIR